MGARKIWNFSSSAQLETSQVIAANKCSRYKFEHKKGSSISSSSHALLFFHKPTNDDCLTISR